VRPSRLGGPDAVGDFLVAADKPDTVREYVEVFVEEWRAGFPPGLRVYAPVPVANQAMALRPIVFPGGGATSYVVGSQVPCPPQPTQACHVVTAQIPSAPDVMVHVIVDVLTILQSRPHGVIGIYA
jgi:hypothetical protein